LPAAGGDSSTRTLRMASRDPRIPPAGSAIVRSYKGKKLRVLVLDGEGFEYDGQRYDTLSAVAKHITGSHINGFRFFGLGKKS